MIKTLKAFNLKDKNILIRTDFNVPMEDGVVMNNFRIKASLPTIKTCIESGAAVVLMSHLGRPKGNDKDSLSLIPVGEELASLLEMPIKFSNNCVSMDAIDTSISLKPGEIHLLENLRFHKGETDNDEEFAARLSRHGHIFINDAFGTAHRSHASNVGIIPYFNNVGIGWLMDRELEYLYRLMHNPKRPLTIVLGGSKIDTKLDLIYKFLNKADNIIIGGGMAFTFLKAKGKSVGRSLVDNTMLDIAKNIINKAREKNVKLSLPIDVLCGNSIKKSSLLGEYLIANIPHDAMGLDIGPESINQFTSLLSNAKTILWNGPMGVFELKDYEMGTKNIAIHLSNCVSNGSKVIVGGGDTAAALELFGLMSNMSHVSTGGGASLELLGGNHLPALKSLEK